MNSAEAHALLKRITYKPGYRIAFRTSFEGLLNLVVTVIAPDSTRQRPGLIEVTHLHTLPPLDHFNEESFIYLLAGFLRDVEIHEINEWLQVDGVAPYDPHEENA